MKTNLNKWKIPVKKEPRLILRNHRAGSPEINGVVRLTEY
jgi:hypothetical protein